MSKTVTVVINNCKNCLQSRRNEGERRAAKIFVSRSPAAPCHIPGWFENFVDGRILTNRLVFMTRLQNDVFISENRECPGN